MNAHEVDFKIYGDDMQCVEIELDPQEAVISESGSMMMMSNDIQMETIFGDGTHKGGFMSKVFAAGKRLLTGESLFLTAFYNNGQGKQHVTFAAPYPGKIIPFDLSQYQNKIICQKDAFLCAAKGVTVGVEFQRRLGTGFFGGEGFIMQKLEGDGMAFAHAGGTIIKKELAVGKSLKIDTGCVVAYTSTVDFDIEFIKGVRNLIFGGEGMFLAHLKGPGTVWIQSLPFSRLASRVIQAAPQTGTKQKGEGSILGGLGNLLDGDNSF